MASAQETPSSEQGRRSKQRPTTPPTAATNESDPQRQEVPPSLPSFYFENVHPNYYPAIAHHAPSGYDTPPNQRAPLGHFSPGQQQQVLTANEQHWVAAQQQQAEIAAARHRFWLCGGWGCFRADPRADPRVPNPRPTAVATPPPAEQPPNLDNGGFGMPKEPFLESQPIQGRKTLVLDLDETLVHSGFQPGLFTSFMITVDLDGGLRNIYVTKRPAVEDFLRYAAEHFEVVIFTASLSKYANPLLDRLDPEGKLIHSRLFREKCIPGPNGTLVKDLAKIGRDLSNTVIVDNSPHAYALQVPNALPIRTWVNNPYDNELMELIPILECIRDCDDVRGTLRLSLKRMCAQRGILDPYDTLLPVVYY